MKSFLCWSKTANFVKQRWTFRITSHPNGKEPCLGTWTGVSSRLSVILCGNEIHQTKIGYFVNGRLNVPLTWTPGFVPHHDVNFTLQLPLEQTCTQASGQTRSDDQDPGHVEDDTGPGLIPWNHSATNTYKTAGRWWTKKNYTGDHHCTRHPDEIAKINAQRREAWNKTGLGFETFAGAADF